MLIIVYLLLFLLAGLIVKKQVIGRYGEAGDDLRTFLRDELISSLSGLKIASFFIKTIDQFLN